MMQIVPHNIVKNGEMFCGGLWKNSVCYSSSYGSLWILSGRFKELFRQPAHISDDESGMVMAILFWKRKKNNVRRGLLRRHDTKLNILKENQVEGTRELNLLLQYLHWYRENARYYSSENIWKQSQAVKGLGRKVKWAAISLVIFVSSSWNLPWL